MNVTASEDKQEITSVYLDDIVIQSYSAAEKPDFE